MLEQNQTNQLEQCSSGAAREGRALMQGLLVWALRASGLLATQATEGFIQSTNYPPPDRHSLLSECGGSAGLIDKTVCERVLKSSAPSRSRLPSGLEGIRTSQPGRRSLAHAHRAPGISVLLAQRRWEG